MSILKWFATYALTAVVFFSIDMVWLGVVAKQFYRSQLGSLMTESVNWVAALLFYALFIVGVLLFVSAPAAATGQVWRALVFGALFGLITYATYDLTNLATLRDWPLLVTAVDLAWGSVLTAIVGTAGYYIIRWIQ